MRKAVEEQVSSCPTRSFATTIPVPEGRAAGADCTPKSDN